MQYELAKLDYEYSALEPSIDAKTMEIHHSKHHATYISNLNKAIENSPLESLKLEELLEKHSDKPAIRNNGGGHWNHTFFWSILSPKKTVITEELNNAIVKSFGSYDKFKQDFIQAGLTRFGSGWAWLCISSDDSLKICSTPNQDNPLMPNVGCEGKPILGVDVWEHAYYLKYQNRRAEYLDAFFNIINWNAVAQKFQKK